MSKLLNPHQLIHRGLATVDEFAALKAKTVAYLENQPGSVEDADVRAIDDAFQDDALWRTIKSVLGLFELPEPRQPE